MPKLSLHFMPARAHLAVLAGLMMVLKAAAPARAQQMDLNTLTASLAKEISRSHKRTFIVVPLSCSDQKDSSLGLWLAKQIAADIVSNAPGLQSLAFDPSNIPQTRGKESGDLMYDTSAVEEFAKKAGAEIIVNGTCGPYGDGLGIAIAASKSGKKGIFATTSGLLSLTPEMRALASQSIRFEPPADGIYRAGAGGVGIPMCTRCSDPAYPEKWRSMGKEGTVILEVVIGADGLAHRITIKEAPDESLASAAVDAVQKWKFKPAIAPDGKPVAVRVPVEITFRLSR